MCVFYELDHKRLESCSFKSKSADLFLLGTFCKKMMKSKEDRLIVPIVYLSVFLQIHVTVVTAILQEGLGAILSDFTGEPRQVLIKLESVAVARY